MPNTLRFLVVDDNADSRFLLVKTLARKFPRAVLQECRSGEVAIGIATRDKLSAMVVHRGFEQDGVALIRRLREAAPSVPIVMVSGVDRTARALEAGADTFLLYDEWLRIGTVVAEIIAKKNEPAPEPASQVVK